MPSNGEYSIRQYPTMAVLRDTWGMKCGHSDGCDETRTIGVEVMIMEDGTIPDIVMYPFCEKHIADYMSEYMFGRQISGILKVM